MSARPIELGVPATAPPSRRIGKYIVSHVLGEGAMGIVYKGVDPHIDRPVAIKTIRKQLLGPDAQDLSAALRFRREAKAAGRLSHPNIVSVYEYGDDRGDLFIAMEFVEGTSLLDLTARGARLGVDDTLSVMLQLLDALHCAHEQGVWHRDIKPANLLVTPDGRLKVTDFGIARIDSSDVTQMNTVMGSPGYMSPERYTADAPDRRVDVFSCGVLLYELLTGAPPFKGSSSAVMYQVLHRDAPPPSGLAIADPPPACFDTIVARAMARSVEDRYGSVLELRDALVAARTQPIRPTLSTLALERLQPAATGPQTQLPVHTAAATTAAAPVLHAPAPAPTLPPRSTDPTTTPAATAASLPADALKRIESLLLPHVGPVARFVLRDAVRRHASAHVMLAALAEDCVAAQDRRAFLRQAAAALPAMAGTAPRRSESSAAATGRGQAIQPGEGSVAGTLPLRADLVDQAQRLLTHHIGPIARVMARRAAAVSTTREEFFTALSDQAAGCLDSRRLLRALWRLA
jgi:serine/threonine-protein kinase